MRGNWWRKGVIPASAPFCSKGWSFFVTSLKPPMHCANCLIGGVQALSWGSTRAGGTLLRWSHASGPSVAYEVIRGAGVGRDLELILDFLVDSAEAFGEDAEAAFALAARRIDEIEAGMEGLGRLPLQGTLRPHLGAGVRNVTKGRVVYFFDVDEAQARLRILAVFFGGQDHEKRILLRLLTGK